MTYLYFLTAHQKFRCGKGFNWNFYIVSLYFFFSIKIFCIYTHVMMHFSATIAQTKETYYHNIKADADGSGSSSESEPSHPAKPSKLHHAPHILHHHHQQQQRPPSSPDIHHHPFHHQQLPDDDITHELFEEDPQSARDFPASLEAAQPWLGGALSWQPTDQLLASPLKRRPPPPPTLSNEAVEEPSEPFFRFPSSSSPFRFRHQSFRHDDRPVEEAFSDFSVVHSPIRTPSSSGSTTLFFPNTFRRRPFFRQVRHFR